MGRKILFVCTDQQRYDTLSCHGALAGSTPVIDRWAAEGIDYSRARVQNTICMPSRSTMLTGQYVRTHGVFTNGVPLPADAPSVAGHLNDNGYRTALIGKAHFEPPRDPKGLFTESTMAKRGSNGPYRGFEHVVLSGHSPTSADGAFHWSQWLQQNHPEVLDGFYEITLVEDGVMRFNEHGNADTGAIQTAMNPVPRDLYHTDWLADQAIEWLRTCDDDEDWFLFLSFPDPHHPWDPPSSEIGRVSWRDLDLPAGLPRTDEEIKRVLDAKPRHWLNYWESGSELLWPTWAPNQLDHDQIREIWALNAIECELIDEACGRVNSYIDSRGWADDLDIVFTSDHGEFQGDFGLLFKGPFHTEALMQVPLIWRPAPASDTTGGQVVDDVVGLVDLAPTFCEIAGLATPDWMQGCSLSDAATPEGREWVLTEWTGRGGLDIHTISSGRWICSRYGALEADALGLGELYDTVNDPHQFENLWDSADHATIRDDLISLMLDEMPPSRDVALTHAGGAVGYRAAQETETS